jgi:anti-sigma-K factor RskA
MTDQDQMPETRDCGGNAAAYVLGALEPGEAEAFRDHLDTCVVCRDEVAAFQQVVDALPMAAPQQRIPPGVRRRVRRRVRNEPKIAVAPDRPRRRVRAVLRPAVAGALTIAAALAVVGGLELSSGGSGGVRVIRASVIGLPGSAEIRLRSGRAELIVNRLSPPPAGRIYEVWLKRAQRPPSPTNALFSVTTTGAGDVDVPGDLRGVNEVLVTPEPAGGSRVPTHAPVIVARLT